MNTSINHITYPGNYFARIVRLLLKGHKLYPDISIKCNKRGNKPFKINVDNTIESTKIKKIFKPLHRHAKILSIYIHGSYADGSQTPFSDIDDFIIIHTDLLQDKNQLKAIITDLNLVDMRLCRLDPLQHHGHWLVSKYELDAYDNSFIPLFILKNAKLLLGSNKISANIDELKTKFGIASNIITTCNNINLIRKKLIGYNINYYELKCLVGSISLLPALIFQFKNIEYDKPNAIKNSQEIYSRDSTMLIQWASECRLNWRIITNQYQYKIFSIFPYLFTNPYLWRKFSAIYSPTVNQSVLEKLSSVKVTEYMFSNFIKESKFHVGQ